MAGLSVKKLSVLLALMTLLLASGCGSKSGRYMEPMDLESALLGQDTIDRYESYLGDSGPDVRGSDRLLLEDRQNLFTWRKTVAVPQPDGTYQYRLSEGSSILVSPFWREETVSVYDAEGRRRTRHFDVDVLAWILYNHSSTRITQENGLEQQYNDGGFLVNLLQYNRENSDTELRFFWLIPIRRTLPY